MEDLDLNPNSVIHYFSELGQIQDHYEFVFGSAKQCLFHSSVASIK